MHILQTVLYISLGADKENFFNNQELLYLVIISFIPVNVWFRGEMQGEIKC